jgi:hypothetical protein
MFSFGEFYTLTDGNGNFSVWELFLFMGIGCVVSIMIGNDLCIIVSLLKAWRLLDLCVRAACWARCA